MYAVKILSRGMIILLSFITIGASIKEILRFCLRNLRGCNVGITDGKSLRNAPLILTQMA
jgi:hypothetical protein